MSYRRMWATLPAVALLSVVMLAAGCAASTTAAAPGAPAVSQSGTGVSQSGTGQGGTASGSAPGATPSAQPGSPGPVPTVTATGTPAPGQPDCANWPTSAPQGVLPPTFVPVQVLRCQLGTTTVPGKGVYVSATLERATQDLQILVDALRRPSGHMLPGTICPALAMIPPQVVLIASNGAMISPRFPVNECGIIQQGVLSALNELRWQALSVRLLSQLPNVSVTAPAPNASGPLSGGISGTEKGIPQVGVNR
ncbi:MAG: hypothetical protein JWM19_5384 [Actinomycetia bacterium]|nr:hypothetical protein [Actinomycetes bacterium]